MAAKYGRRATVFAMSLFALAAAAVLISAKTKEHMISARIINCFYIVCIPSVSNSMWQTTSNG